MDKSLYLLIRINTINRYFFVKLACKLITLITIPFHFEKPGCVFAMRSYFVCRPDVGTIKKNKYYLSKYANVAAGIALICRAVFVFCLFCLSLDCLFLAKYRCIYTMQTV